MFGETEPLHVSDSIVVVGLNSVRAWRQQGGALDDDRLALGMQRLQEGPPDALRVVALHHHLAAPPWRVARKLPLSRRDDGLARARRRRCGARHRRSRPPGGIAERREFKVLEEGPRRSLVLATSAALGRPRPERKEEARGLNVYDADAATITVRTFSWDGTGFLQVGERQFSRR